jgi:hypothetical protein
VVAGGDEIGVSSIALGVLKEAPGFGQSHIAMEKMFLGGWPTCRGYASLLNTRARVARWCSAKSLVCCCLRIRALESESRVCLERIYHGDDGLGSRRSEEQGGDLCGAHCGLEDGKLFERLSRNCQNP